MMRKDRFFIVGGYVGILLNFGHLYEKKCAITKINILLKPKVFLLLYFFDLKIDALDKNIISILLVVAQMIVASKWKNYNPLLLVRETRGCFCFRETF